MNRQSIFILTIILILLSSCTEWDNFSPLPPSSGSRGDLTRALRPVVSNGANVYSYAVESKGQSSHYDGVLNFTTDSVSWSLTITNYAGGKVILHISDSSGNPIISDTLSSDTLLSRSNVIGKKPSNISIQIISYSGKFSFNLVRKDAGLGYDIFGIWRWEYGRTGFANTYVSPGMLGYSILYRFDHDSILTIFKNDSVVYSGPFTITPPEEWSQGDQVLHCFYPYGDPFFSPKPWIGLFPTNGLWEFHADSINIMPPCCDAGWYVYSRVKFE